MRAVARHEDEHILFHAPLGPGDLCFAKVKVQDAVHEPAQIGDAAVFVFVLVFLGRVEHVHVKAEARDVEIDLVVCHGRVHFPNMTLEQDLERPVGVLRNAKRTHKVVARAAGNDAERGLRASERGRSLAHRAVSAEHRDAGRTARSGLERELYYMPRIFAHRGTEGDAARFQHRADTLKGCIRSAVSCDRIPDDVELRHRSYLRLQIYSL